MEVQQWYLQREILAVYHVSMVAHVYVYGVTCLCQMSQLTDARRAAAGF